MGDALLQPTTGDLTHPRIFSQPKTESPLAYDKVLVQRPIQEGRKGRVLNGPHRQNNVPQNSTQTAIPSCSKVGQPFVWTSPCHTRKGRQSELSSYHVNLRLIHKYLHDRSGIQFDQTSRHPRHGSVKLTNISDCHQM